MAKTWASPEEIAVPEFEDFQDDDGRFSFEAYDAATKEYEEKLRAWCKANSSTKSNPLVGCVWRHQIADGYACYMVLSTKPLELIHMAINDEYQAPEYAIRGLRVADIQRQVDSNRRWKEMTAK